MTQYISKPPTVDAHQFLGTIESAQLISGWLSSYGCTVGLDPLQNQLIVQTQSYVSGNPIMILSEGMWLIRRVTGEIEKMTNEVFVSQYDPLPDPEQA